ncbi:MAG: MFS transporter [Myxococcota bacterium]
MTNQRLLFTRFPAAFWAANTLEIFERMAWYGFYAVSSLYLTGSRASGGLGLTSEDRGVIQGIVTFLLYLFPAVFGALADRYGYKRMFIASFAVMVPGYLLLGQATDFWSFLGIYTFVAIGHGMFKPVVIATVAKTTNAETGTLGFGIFYMMVNVGGFLGPAVAGVVRGWGWDKVFYFSALWALINVVLAAVLYREPGRGEGTPSTRTMREVLGGMVSVVGNFRFFTLVAGLLVLLVMGSRWLPFDRVGLYALVWVAANLLVDVIVRARWAGWEQLPFLRQPAMRIGDGRYMLFLLLMAGFWTSFNQLFITVPEYIRDYTNTDGIVASLAAVGIDLRSAGATVFDHGKIKPEYLINLNAAGIIVFQVLVSILARKLKAFTTIVSGIVITIVSFLVFLGGAEGWMVVAAILIFSFGEMMASPKSKEYAGRIAPPDKVGMYMGYFFWCVALGNLFGGLLSGRAYGYFGPQGINRPEIMWWIFAGLAGLTAVSLLAYDRWVGAHSTRS